MTPAVAIRPNASAAISAAEHYSARRALLRTCHPTEHGRARRAAASGLGERRDQPAAGVSSASQQRTQRPVAGEPNRYSPPPAHSERRRGRGGGAAARAEPGRASRSEPAVPAGRSPAAAAAAAAAMSWLERPAQAEVNGLRLSRLGVDQAFVNVSSELPGLWLYRLSHECLRCPFSLYSEIDLIEEPLIISTKYSETWRILSDGSLPTVPVSNQSSVVCELNPNLGEFGVYDLWIHDVENETLCDVTSVLKPVNIYLPLAICLFGLIVLWGLFSGASAAIDRWRRSNKRTITPIGHDLDSSEDKESNPPVKKQRVKSLDAFRGISIVLMIFVNHGAGGYAILEHATWNGLQLADLLFPWFMWIMGVCVPISVISQLKKNVPRCQMFVAVLRRSCILFLLGVTLNTVGRGGDLEKIRIFGVLQRFGVVYLIIATMCIFFSCRRCNKPKIKCLAAVHDMIILLPQWIVVCGFVAGHCALIFLLPVPGCPLGYLGPGGNHENGEYKNCIGGATGYVDKLVLGTDHVYQTPTAGEIYNAGPFDPEGIVGCLLSVFQVFLGVQAGAIIVVHHGWRGRVVRWLLWGTAAGIGGAVLCLASKEDGWIPVNKNLWSLSYVLITSCFAFYLLSICYILIDVKKWWSGAPFFYPGMNATIMYVGHSVAYNLFPWHWVIGSMNTHFMLLLENIWGTLLWIVIAVWLHHIQFFLSI